MKMNKKGFTLIELLAVVVILLAISVMAISSISAAIERNKTKENNARIEVIISYAKIYYDDHKNSLGTSGSISLDDLISNNYMTEEERLDSDGDIFTGVVCYTDGANFTYDEDGTC